MHRLAMAVATCCGVGRCPVAPGTAGAAVGLLPAVLLAPWPILYAAATVALFFAGVAAGTAAEKALGEKDPPRVVIDEAASVMITFAFVPLTAGVLLAGFILNRALDILKPFPAGRSQALPGGWGIMVDDLFAGIYANAALQLMRALGWLG